MIYSKEWKDYECFATGDGEKVERYGDIILRRPDAQIVWPKRERSVWNGWDGFYHRSNQGGGSWEFRKKVSDFWTIGYRDLVFKVAPTNFKHTGIFPEQAINWDFITERIKRCEGQEIRILNLFAYTGCATIAASKAGATEVVHVDASRGMVDWAKENMKLNHLEGKTIRFLVDDVMKFLEREKRRGRTYHGIIMDPPSYGRGPNGELWKLENSLGELISKAKEVLDEDFSFLLVNSYTTGISPTSLANLLAYYFDENIETGEIGLPVSEDNLVLPCGIYGRVTKD